MFRLMVFDGNLAFYIMEKESWTYVWFLLIISIIRVLLVGLIRVMVLQSGAKGTAGELFATLERKLTGEISGVLTQLGFDDNRSLNFESFCAKGTAGELFA